jgi:glutathione peroxidase
MSIYDFSYTSIENKKIDMNEYKGKVVLIINTASKCGFTNQYEGLETLYKTYKDKGLVVIGFPCDQFNDQEFDSSSEISEFCKVKFGVTFPLSQKINVRGEDAHPIFKYLIKEKGFEGLGKGLKIKALEVMLKAKYKKTFNDDEIKWNFTKFLVDKEGNVVQRFESPVDPEDMAVTIEALLG